MKQEEIHQALRFVAMGRVNHPQVEEFADNLAGLFARDVLPVVEMPAPVEIALVSEPAEPSIDAEVAEVRRTRRARKAD